ncbi:GGDEF domain-containing protein [Parasedimentitalea marina]|uniref:GGDEF domain-containing protein n=1 Tax=Parasedimentitalea marina TaxID=2483033 RepID=A0A3T0MZ60_9RHOB|nr:bifunctional diguanylate cyclase/phosphodiesterase [Parasedimentitalea marina]AZV77050.1 GGDEF domain-containing protein [Parasedimentitalea marina]
MFEENSQSDLVDPSIVRLTTAFAFAVSLAISILVPVSYFYFGLQFVHGKTTAQADMNSEDISQLVGRNPLMWHFETLRITEFLGGYEDTEIWKVFDVDGQLVAQVGMASIPSPVILTSHAFFDSGIEAGRLEVTYSIRPLAYRSLAVFFLSTLLGGLVFIGMRTLPLRVLRQAIEHASFLASHDPLTELPNRSLFNNWLINAIADVDRQQTPLAVLCLDLDHFKDVNDLLGHAAGDDLLKQATERLIALLDSNDLLARLGGDEFAIVQKSADQPSGATQLANLITAELSRPFDLDGNEAIIGTSVGITVLTDGSHIKATTLLQQADLALYRAKNECRGSIQFYAEEMNQQLLIRKKLESDLRIALTSDQLDLEFQPQIDLATGKIVGVEALLRWNHPTEGRIPPDQFIGLAEETGLIIPIGEWVIRSACAHARDWPELKFAVNVSPVQFRSPNLLELIRSSLADENVEPGRLEIEITEGILIQNTEETIAILTQLKDMGVRIAMDDFGTGYSSLNYLRRFDFDKIKIDQSFTAGLGHSPEADSIIQAVIDLGASLGMTSNAEGVETMEQARILKDQGCKEVQGYYFGRPMASSSIQELLADQDWMSVEAKAGGTDEATITDISTARMGTRSN